MVIPSHAMAHVPPSLPAAADLLSSPPPDADESVWYGNIQYILNISAAGAACCVLLFLHVKLLCDHHRIPGPTTLLAKLLAVYHATAPQIALQCGADASQFLHIERGSFAVLLAVSVVAVAAVLPLNLYGGSAPIADQFSRTTINHISRGSQLLWVHFPMMMLVVALAHFGIAKIEEQLRITRFRDGNGNPCDPNANSIAIFTIMVQGIPKFLAADKVPVEEYFQHRYPGKVYRVIMPFDLCTLDGLVTRWTKVQNDISRLEARLDSRRLSDDSRNGAGNSWNSLWTRLKDIWAVAAVRFGFTDEVTKLEARFTWETAGLQGRPGAGCGYCLLGLQRCVHDEQGCEGFQKREEE